MGIFYSGALIGPALAPAVAGPSLPSLGRGILLMSGGDTGVLTEYAKPIGSGWRAMQWLLFAMGVVASLLVLFFLPETSHVLGVDLIREERNSKREAEEKESGVVRERSEGVWERWTRDWVVVWLNPLAPLKMLLHPHILAMVRSSPLAIPRTDPSHRA